MATILSIEELEIALGISGTSTTAEIQQMALIHGAAEGAVKKYICYNPVQQTHIEFYPCRRALGDDWWDFDHHHHWEVDSLTSPVQAVRRHGHTLAASQLILHHRPVRSVTEIREDHSARGGQNVNDFPASTILTLGTDYYLDEDSDGIAFAPIVYRDNGAWSTKPRSIRVTYVAGFTADEFMGLGLIDASSIKHAAILVAQWFYNRLEILKKKTGSGFGGPLKSETLDLYSYTLDSSGLSSMIGPDSTGLPMEAKELLEPWVNYGVVLC